MMRICNTDFTSSALFIPSLTSNGSIGVTHGAISVGFHWFFKANAEYFAINGALWAVAQNSGLNDEVYSFLERNAYIGILSWIAWVAFRGIVIHSEESGQKSKFNDKFKGTRRRRKL